MRAPDIFLYTLFIATGILYMVAGVGAEAGWLIRCFFFGVGCLGVVVGGTMFLIDGPEENAKPLNTDETIGITRGEQE